MNLAVDCLKAFLVGGGFCLLGQVLIDYTKLTPARILVAYVVLGVFLTGLGVYSPIVEFAGAGATVPLTGFGYTLAKGVQKGITQYGWFGILSGGLTATAAGITVAITAGYVVSLVAKARSK